MNEIYEVTITTTVSRPGGSEVSRLRSLNVIIEPDELYGPGVLDVVWKYGKPVDMDLCEQLETLVEDITLEAALKENKHAIR